MSYDRERHHRRSIRRGGYDYAQDGIYFVTICTQGRVLFFDDEIVREIAERCWSAIPEHYPLADLDEWVVMPNHVHGLIVIGGQEGDSRERPGVLSNAPTMNARSGAAREMQQPSEAALFPHVAPLRNSLGVIIRAYKAAVTATCRREGFLGFGWQRNYYDRIVRNDRELNSIRRYIFENPQRWEMDEHHPERLQRLRAGTAPPHL